MAFDENGAGSLGWYQESYAAENSIAELLDMAAGIQAGSKGLKAKPCARSYNNLEGFENIQPQHHHGHFVRALLESTALSLKKIIEKLSALNTCDAIVATGGGAMSSLWVEIKADMAGKTFLIPECTEAACFGAAMVAAASTHQFKDLYEISESWIKTKETIGPDPARHELYSRWSEKSLDYN
jgi:sugar (pentulose or hexulose) kinase